MSEKKSRMTLREAFDATRRGYSILWKAMPEFFPASLAKNALTALSPYLPLYFTARLVNAVAGGGGGGEAWPLLAALLLSTALMGAARAAASCRANVIEEARSIPVRLRLLMEKLLDMDFQDVDDSKTKDLLNQIMENEQWASWGLVKLQYRFNELAEAVLRILGALALSVSLFTLPVPQGSPLAALNSPWCLPAMLALMGAAVVLSALCYSRAQAFWSAMDGSFFNRAFEALNCHAHFNRSASADIRVYAQDRFLFQKADDPALDGFGPNSAIGRASWGPRGLLMAASVGITRIYSGAVYLFAGLKALGGAFGVGSIAQYVGALAGLSNGAANLLSVLSDLRENAPYLLPLFQLLDMPNRMYQGSLTTEKRSDRNYEIEFRDVGFQYPNTDAWALRHVSMKFKVGGRLAVVGENGSGKTTFIKLLCRLYDPTEGVILLNGIDIRKYRYDDYLALFSVVFQDFKLLSQPLGKNVAASEDYDRARAEDCLRRAGFGERLDQLPQGLDTWLYRDFDEGGVEVSGGEAQKIALARVLYQDAPFIVLDEPTAALDPEAEAEIYTKFNDIVGDKTAIYISHRLSSCRFCGEIAVFDGGRVVQQGAHAGLVEAPGKYRSLWEAQARYYERRRQAMEADME